MDHAEGRWYLEVHMTAVQVLQKSLLIVAFVTVMMLVIEYADARWGRGITKHLHVGGFRQLVLAAVLGATPGCLGAFVTVSLFAQRRVTVGALVAAMIATSGDEAFVMFALFPWQALLLTLALAAVGVAAGWATDRFLGKRAKNLDPCCSFAEQHPEHCDCLPPHAILTIWKRPSLLRWLITATIAAAAVLMGLGWLGPPEWGWKRVTLIFVTAIGLFVVASVPETFLRNHLVKHVLARHVPRIFAWTAGTLAIMALLEGRFDLSSFVSSNRWSVLALASGLGVVPESGPHLLFTTLYAKGAAPMSILMASSIVQDGHGMLPLLAQSRRWFLIVKAINLAVGLVVGALLLLLGW